MLTLHINGQKREIQDGISLQELLQDIGLSPQALAVAVNSEIVPRSELERVHPRNGDQIEIIRAVGGG